MVAKYEKYKKNTDPGKARDKKIVLTILAVCVAFIVLYYGVVLVENIASNSKKTTSETKKISFYPANYDEDITEDEYYMGLDRQIYFEDSDYGTTIAITDADAGDVSCTYLSAFKVLYEYVECAIAGDNEGMNALFSDLYYNNGGEERAVFTPQKLYNITISILGTDETEEDGITYDRYSYSVSYMIYKNNGTFRNDMGSDCIKREYFTVTNRDGKVKIDEYAVYRTAE